MYYTGRDMPASHKGMGITAKDAELFLGHARATLEYRHPIVETTKAAVTRRPARGKGSLPASKKTKDENLRRLNGAGA